MKTALYVIAIFAAAALFASMPRFLSERDRKAAYEKTVEASANAVMSTQSAGSIAYVLVDQKVPGVVCVKKIAVFQNAINQFSQLSSNRIISAVPWGNAVMIDGEPAYPGMVLTVVKM